MLRRRIWRLPLAKMLQMTLALAGFVVAILVRIEPKSYAAIFANAALFVAFLWLNVLVHEVGHAAIAAAVGIRVGRVTVGTGAPVLSWRIRGVTWRLGAVPFAGRTTLIPSALSWIRVRYWLVIVGGPLVNLVILLVAGRFVEPNAALTLAPARMLQVSAGIILVGSLIPYVYGGTASDGLLLLFMWRMRPPVLSEVRAAAYAVECVDATNAGQLDAAKEACRLGLLEAPDNVALRNARGLIHLRAGEFAEAHELFRSLAATPDLAPHLRAICDNNIAFCSAFLDDDDLLEQADQRSKQVLERFKLPSFRGTRGTILVLRGKPRSALRHLQRAYESHTEDSALAHNAAWLAAAEGALGNAARAERWLEAAESLDASCYSIPRVRQLLRRSA